MGLNKSVKSLSGRFETFSNNIEGKVNKLQSEFVLMKNKVEFIERNLGVVNQASRSSAEYTINTHPSSQQYSGSNGSSGGAAGVVGAPSRPEPVLLNFAHEQSMKSV